MTLKRFIYNMVSAVLVAFVATACSTDVLMDEPKKAAQQEPTPYAIDFSESFINNSVGGTRSGLIGLSEYTSTMGVWGWRTTLDGRIVDETQFRNKQIRYNGSSWQYSPKKYWISGSRYRFYAYAPFNNEATIDSLSGLISIDGIRLTGDNILKDSPSATLAKNFRSSPDIDWMVARGGQTAFGSTVSQVEFTMLHILSKMNVSVRIEDGFEYDFMDIVIDSLKIGSFISGGDFRQLYESNTIGETSEWTLDSTSANVTLNSARNTIVNTTKTYILESLVIPQGLDSTKTVKLYYSYNYNDGRSEKSAYMLELDQAFGNVLKSGYSYDINLIFKPGAITFDASVSDWATYYDSTRYLK